MNTVNKNNASQTLFRFVSVRNPQLTETKPQNLGFIHRPNEITGLFDDAVAGLSSGQTKLLALLNKSSEFASSSFKTEKELEDGIFGQLLIIGRKISRKEVLESSDYDYVQNYYNNYVDSAGELTRQAIDELSQLWNNLIYQVVTRKDFYVKEAVVHILKALHLGFAQNVDETPEMKQINGDDLSGKALEAKVVLPAKLFLDGVEPIILTAKSGENDELNIVSQERLKIEAQSEMMLSESLYNKTELENLKKELEQLQEDYFQSKNAAYNEQYQQYIQENQSAIDEYNRKLEEIEQNISEETPKGEIEEMYQGLEIYEVEPFVFSYEEELDVNKLQEKLSAESFALFMDIFSDVGQSGTGNPAEQETPPAVPPSEAPVNSSLQRSNNYQNYASVLEKIRQMISSHTQFVLDNSVLSRQQYINLGGALIPVIENTRIAPFAYTITARQMKSPFLSDRGFVNFSFEVEDDSWNVSVAKITAETNNGTAEESYGNINVVNNKISLPLSFVNKFKDIYQLNVQIFFSNGREANVEINEILNDQTYVGKLDLKSFPTDEMLPTQTPENNGVVRNNFGIKRLGIADYLKVVQSVHAYVPGEVSNIENVMASELRHKSSVARDYSEITDSTSKSQETEKISDTSKTSRTDMQTEVARELDRQQSITGHTRFSYGGNKTFFEVGAEYANNTSQQDSTRQAVAKSQEITEKALERVLTKISEERVEKIIKEYTETNVHEFDNRGKVTDTDNPDAAQPKHITGVYRWIDKKMKNQIYNYGKRAMFEFMIPEPARLHKLATMVSGGQILTAPIDPRKAEKPYNMPNAKTATKELLEYWANIYGVQLETFLVNAKQIIHNAAGVPQTNNDFINYSQFAIPDNYAGRNASFSCRSSRNRGGGSEGSRYSQIYCSDLKGGMVGHNTRGAVNFDKSVSGLYVTGNVSFQVTGHNVSSYNIKVTVNCELSDEYINTWKTESFNAIIAAYEAAYQKYLDDQKLLDEEQKAKEAEAKEREAQNNFYRYMEADVLKHNCIAYLLQDYLNKLGQSFTNGDKMENFQVYLNANLDKYTALAKFMEQAFEWEIMDYTFYPYYWGGRKMWKDMYLSENMDPLFRSFLQAGMARVIVTVKPGFEDALNFFLSTGQIWNGGEVPVIGDPLYLSIVDELRQPTGIPQGKYWITKIPTTLTILQDKSTGLPVEQPLPIFPETDPENCENPLELEGETSFTLDDANLQRSEETSSTLD